MRVIDYSCVDPAENLALDEVLLNELEEGRGGEILRFWESPTPFVVLGVSQRLTAEVHEEACAADDIPILRRCSAGGCVVQGPGSLNFCLVLAYDGRPELETIASSYDYILGSLAQSFVQHGVGAAREGISDLAVDHVKFSGNAQKRRRRGLLHHGTLLYVMQESQGLSAGSLTRYLREPEERPAYRGDRLHGDFVGGIRMGVEELRVLVSSTFGCCGALERGPESLSSQLMETQALVKQKYGRRDWTWRR